MPIEFRCSQCGKLLRTGDDTAGRQAQCPECGTIGTVPGPAGPPEPVVPTAAPLGDEGPPAAGARPGSPFAAGAAPAASLDAPYQPSSPFDYQLPPGQLYAEAAQRVSGPATALIVIGWLGIDPVRAAVIVWTIYVVARGLRCAVERRRAIARARTGRRHRHGRRLLRGRIGIVSASAMGGPDRGRRREDEETPELRSGHGRGDCRHDPLHLAVLSAESAVWHLGVGRAERQLREGGVPKLSWRYGRCNVHCGSEAAIPIAGG